MPRDFWKWVRIFLYVFLLFSAILYPPQYCWKDVLCSSDIMWLVKCFHSEKKLSYEKILYSYNNQLIHDVCIVLFRYPPILHFIPWTWSRQPGELSISIDLFLHNLQCMHCFMWIRCLKNQQPGLSLHFHCHFFLHSLAYKRKKSWLQVTSLQHLLRTLCKHILCMV